MRTIAYIDGFNLYYRCLKNTPYKWLDLRALLEGLLRPENHLERIRYYTARVSGRDDPESPKRQHAYLRAIQTIQGLSIHYGTFLAKEIVRPLVNPISGLPAYVKVHTTEEKGSDVNLASHLIRDGFQDAYEVAVVLSNDTDLLEPIRIVTQELKQPVGLVTPVGILISDN